MLLPTPHYLISCTTASLGHDCVSFLRILACGAPCLAEGPDQRGRGCWKDPERCGRASPGSACRAGVTQERCERASPVSRWSASERLRDGSIPSPKGAQYLRAFVFCCVQIGSSASGPSAPIMVISGRPWSGGHNPRDRRIFDRDLGMRLGLPLLHSSENTHTKSSS